MRAESGGKVQRPAQIEDGKMNTQRKHFIEAHEILLAVTVLDNGKQFLDEQRLGETMNVTDILDKYSGSNQAIQFYRFDRLTGQSQDVTEILARDWLEDYADNFDGEPDQYEPETVPLYVEVSKSYRTWEWKLE
jgi:hypothetical protein